MKIYETNLDGTASEWNERRIENERRKSNEVDLKKIFVLFNNTTFTWNGN